MGGEKKREVKGEKEWTWIRYTIECQQISMLRNNIFGDNLNSMESLSSVVDWMCKGRKTYVSELGCWRGTLAYRVPRKSEREPDLLFPASYSLQEAMTPYPLGTPGRALQKYRNVFFALVHAIDAAKIHLTMH